MATPEPLFLMGSGVKPFLRAFAAAKTVFAGEVSGAALLTDAASARLRVHKVKAKGEVFMACLSKQFNEL
jgi:hypothetical protein